LKKMVNSVLVGFNSVLFIAGRGSISHQSLVFLPPTVHFHPLSTTQSSLHPSPPFSFPSSHSYPDPTLIPSPHLSASVPFFQAHPGSSWQISVHPSRLIRLPSSHYSRPSTKESPQISAQRSPGDSGLNVAPIHVKPSSTSHRSEQPSPEILFPSSHC
jgi:hypothetical protein